MVHSAPGGAGGQRLLDDVLRQFQQMILAQAVPPTVIRSILMVGMPDADRHALPLLAADADAFVELAGRCRPC